MKGQFFIISAVIIILSFTLLVQLFSDYGKTDLTIIEEFREGEYIAMVKNSLINTTQISLDNAGCARLDADLKGTEEFLNKSLMEKGIILYVDHGVGCPYVEFFFTLTSPNFYSETSFDYP